MKIQITIPDSICTDVEEYCQRELGMSFQQYMQQIASDKVKNIMPHIELRRGLKKDLDKFFDEFGKVLKEEANAR